MGGKIVTMTRQPQNIQEWVGVGIVRYDGVVMAKIKLKTAEDQFWASLVAQ